MWFLDRAFRVGVSRIPFAQHEQWVINPETRAQDGKTAEFSLNSVVIACAVEDGCTSLVLLSAAMPRKIKSFADHVQQGLLQASEEGSELQRSAHRLKSLTMKGMLLQKNAWAVMCSIALLLRHVDGFADLCERSILLHFFAAYIVAPSCPTRDGWEDPVGFQGGTMSFSIWQAVLRSKNPYSDMTLKSSVQGLQLHPVFKSAGSCVQRKAFGWYSLFLRLAHACPTLPLFQVILSQMMSQGGGADMPTRSRTRKADATSCSQLSFSSASAPKNVSRSCWRTETSC